MTKEDTKIANQWMQKTCLAENCYRRVQRNEFVVCRSRDVFLSGISDRIFFFFWTIIDQDLAEASLKLMHSIPLQVSFGPVDQIFQKKTQFFRVDQYCLEWINFSWIRSDLSRLDQILWSLIIFWRGMQFSRTFETYLWSFYQKYNDIPK